MSLARALDDLELLARDREAALDTFARRGRERSWDIFRRIHLPLLLLYPAAALLCPLSYILGRGPSLTGVLVPAMLVVVFLVQAALFDRVLEYGSHRTLESEEEPRFAQIALYFHLPLSAGGIFFLILPALGYIMLLLGALFCVGLSIFAQSRARGVSLARALTAYISAALLPLSLLFVLAVVYNLYHTVAVLRGLN